MSDGATATGPQPPYRILVRRITLTTDCNCGIAIPAFGLDWDGRSPAVIGGWFAHRAHRVERILMDIDGKTIAATAPHQQRPAVADKIAGWPDAATPGWQLAWRPQPDQHIHIRAELAEGSTLLIGELRVVSCARPALIFIHIPKTAGTTVNHLAQSLVGETQAHLHVENLTDFEIQIAAWTATFVSGHIPLARWRNLLPLELFRVAVVLREPLSHIASHLAWVRHLAEPEQAQRLLMHPPYIQALAAKLARCDLSSPTALAGLIAKLEPGESALFENVQVRYLRPTARPGTIADADAISAADTLKNMTVVGLSEGLPGFVARLRSSLGSDPGDLTIPTLNTLSSKFGMDPANAGFRDAVKPLVARDQILYERARSRLGG